MKLISPNNLAVIVASSFSAEQRSEETSAPPTFFSPSTSSPYVTPEKLDTYAGGRDHVYVNKVLRHPYHQTMSHQPMHPDDWIEIDADYRRDLAAKRRLIETQGKVVMDIIDDDTVRLGCQELMEHICQWLTVRYPSLFTWRTAPSLGEDPAIVNHATAESIPLVDPNTGKMKHGTTALDVVSRLVQDDFLISSPIADGHWLCAGGLVCFPGFYLLSEKINTPLRQTHEPVPQFNEKILLSVERTLTRLDPAKPIERTSWEIVDSDEDQFWVPMAGPLPTSTGAKPLFPHHLTGRDPGAVDREDPAKLLLRLDHQTFTKMPKSGIVFFGVHPFRRKLSALRESPLLPRLLLDIHADGPKDIMKYKAAPAYEASVLPYLEQLHQWQCDVGLVKDDDRPQDFRQYKDRKPVTMSV